MINWRVRIRNKAFWMTFVPAVLLLVQTVCAAIGVTIDLSALGQRLLAVVNAVFTVLAILGIVNDPTTNGLNDSEQAMTYNHPKE